MEIFSVIPGLAFKQVVGIQLRHHGRITSFGVAFCWLIQARLRKRRRRKHATAKLTQWEDLTVLVLPTLRTTKSGEQEPYPGTLSLSGETLQAILKDIAASVSRAGVERLCLFNGHGGNTALLEIAVRDMRITHDLIAVHCSWFGFADFEAHYTAEELSKDIHAGDCQTLHMLAAHPCKVDMRQAKNFKFAMQDRPETWIGLTGQAARPGWVIDDLNADGACGDAASATRKKGDALLNSAAENFAAFLREFAAFDHRTDKR